MNRRHITMVAAMLLAQPLPAMAAPTDDAAVRALIVRGYGSYRSGKQSDGFYNLTSPALRKVWDSVVEEAGVLDTDPFCNCQDYDENAFRFKIVSVTVKKSTAFAVVSVNTGQPILGSNSQWNRYWLTFVKLPQGWRIDDLQSGPIRSLKSGVWHRRN